MHPHRLPSVVTSMQNSTVAGTSDRHSPRPHSRSPERTLVRAVPYHLRSATTHHRRQHAELFVTLGIPHAAPLKKLFMVVKHT